MPCLMTTLSMRVLTAWVSAGSRREGLEVEAEVVVWVPLGGVEDKHVGGDIERQV